MNKLRIILILVICVFLIGNVFATPMQIKGLTTNVGGSVYCAYNLQNNNCVLSQDANYTVTSNFINVTNFNPNLLISANIKLIVDLNYNKPITIKDFNSIVISSGKSLIIENNSISSLDLTFENVNEIRINQFSEFLINDNSNKNISSLLNHEMISEFYTNSSALQTNNVINLHSGNINLENTKLFVDGNFNIDLNQNVVLSNNLPVPASSCLLDSLNYFYVGMIDPKPQEDDGSSEETDVEDDVDYEDDAEEVFCYKYLKFDSCEVSASYYYPKAEDSNSVYFCFNVKDSVNQIKIKDINATNRSSISLFSKFRLQRNIEKDKTYYLGNDNKKTYESFDSYEDPIDSQTDFFFENYSGKIPVKLDNRGVGSVIFNTCGPITLLPISPNYNVCRFIFVRPEGFLQDLNRSNASAIATFFRYEKNCNYESLEDQASSYLLVDSNQTVTPLVFGNIVKMETSQTISPSFTLNGLYDINTQETRISYITDQFKDDDFFILYLTPNLSSKLNILKNYQFKFKLNANQDFNYSEINLYYPFKLYK